MKDLAIFCADIGSIANNKFGWAYVRDNQSGQGTSIDHLTHCILDSVQLGFPVALGFECPLFVPIPDDAALLGKGRLGERSRPWSAHAGSNVLATGIIQTTWILRNIRQRLISAPTIYVDWDRFLSAGAGLFLWEAFVSGSSKKDLHEDDAKAAVDAFRAALPDITSASCITTEQTFSLIAAAALRAGWPDAVALLDKPCVVIAG